MSANAFSPAPTTRNDLDLAAQHATLRIAFGVTAGFAIAEALDWDFTFLAPMLAAQVLAKPGPAPTVGQALGMIIMFGVSAGTVLLLSTAFVTTPPVLVLALAL